MNTSKSIFEAPQETTEATEADYDRYREMCVAAVAALAVGLASLPSLIFPVLLFIPFIGIIVGIMALRTIRRRPSELIGGGQAKIGLALSLVCLVAGSSIATTVYMTEVPEGYERISFSQLQPDKSRPELPVSPFALEQNAKQVFLKGYIYPGDRKSNLSRFVLVPDMGTCCFGGQPKLTDMVEIILEDPLRADWSTRRRRLGGTLMVDTRKKPITGLDGVYYVMKVNYMDGRFAE